VVNKRVKTVDVTLTVSSAAASIINHPLEAPDADE